MFIIRILKQTLAEQIYKNIREDIIENKLTGGQKFTIKQIQDLYGVSSTPAREALYLLSKEGLIEMHTNQGVNVVEFNLEKSLEIHEINQILDLYALKKAMSHPNRKSLISKLENTFEISSEQHKKKNYRKLYYENYFHNVLYDFVDNKIIKDLKEGYKALFSIVVLKSHFFDNFYASEEEHSAVLEAIKKDNYELANKLFNDHFISGREQLIKFYTEKENKKDIK